MTVLSRFDTFILALASKVHDLAADALMVAICASASPPVATNAKLSDLTEISYAHLSSRAVTTTALSVASGNCRLYLADVMLQASGGVVGPLRYLVLYNTTALNKELIGFYDYSTDTMLMDGEKFVLDFDGTNGVLGFA